jgi:hypothetical protein
VRKIHAAALKHVALLEQARDAAATLRTLPALAQERFAVDLFERLHDARLQVEQPGLDGGRRGGGHGDGFSLKVGRLYTADKRRDI